MQASKKTSTGAEIVDGLSSQIHNSQIDVFKMNNVDISKSIRLSDNRSS